MNRLITFFLLLLSAMILTACSLAAPAPVSTAPVNRPTQSANQEPLQLPTRRPNAADGAELFAQHCSACHGNQGRGDGARAAQIQAQNGSPVADLTADTIARAQTPEQWYATVTNGRLDKLMPPFAGVLNVDQRWDIIVYGWTLSVPPAQIAQGKQVYAAQCVQCHGEKGQGDGPDAKGNLPDFTNFSTIVSIASGTWDQSLSTSHLPSYAGTLSVADQRAAIDYVRSFAYDYPTNLTPSTQAAPSAASTGSVTSTTSLTGTPPLPGTVDGYIVNGTAGASTPGNLPITFYVFPGGTGNTVVTQTLQSDAQGRFVVNNVQASHGDLIAAGTTYNDLQFHSELVPYAAQISITVPITVYESTTDASKIQIETLHIVVVPDANGLQVSEIYVLSNSSDRWVAGFGQPIMHLGLPVGAQNFSIDPNSMLPDTLVPNGDGLDYYEAVPVGSGSAQIIYQYSLPGGSAVLDRPLFQNVSVVNMLIEGDPAQVSVSSPQLTSAGPQTIQGKTYQQYKGANLAAGQTLSITIGSAAAGASLSWPVIAGIALVVVGVVGLVLWLRSRRKLAGATLDLGGEREALLDQIAALDDDFEAGQIDKIDYNARRARLKAKLLKLMQNSNE